MKNFKYKKLAVALAIGVAASTSVLVNDVTSAAQNDANVSVNVSVSQPTKIINWYKGSDSDIIADGIGKSGGKGMSMARMAAVMDAQRNLLGIIKGVQIDSDTLMEDLIISSDVVKRNISGLLRGAQIIEEYQRNDDEYYVKMRVPLYGSTESLAAAVMPEVRKNTERTPFPTADNSELTEAEVQEIRDASYTGVVINADGIDPTFSPVIYDTEGRAVYGVENLDYDKVVADGMVNYTESVEGAIEDGRAGNNPLIINAVGTTGGSNNTNVNAVVSVEDANKILVANESTGILEDTSVVFVR
ncbi:MAG: LPP20 family lipoprotein [Selenomonadaceae bacterium]|nr:LPP20 family lipoprotein [Selenomonadaceae bacterium]